MEKFRYSFIACVEYRAGSTVVVGRVRLRRAIVVEFDELIATVTGAYWRKCMNGIAGVKICGQHV